MEVININSDQKIVLDTQANEIEININNCRAIITDISKGVKKININDGSLDYCYIKKDTNDIVTNVNVTSGSADVKVIDILNNASKNNYSLNLLDEGSEINFSVATVARVNDNKDYKIDSVNDARYSNVKIDCFGISENESCIKYDITSYIKKGAKQSVVNQSSKILLFDKESKGINNPILEIEENDVKANHGSSIGMIDEETLFYLTSRGIEEKDARNLVSIGRINYLINEVKDEKIKEDLLKEVLERV